jgi:isoquinoline 1-oxidoreductase subunit beta
MRRPIVPDPDQPLITRRKLIVGAVAGGALVVGWSLWPRISGPNLATAPGETLLNGFVKIGKDGHIVVVSPQIEMGQGSYTLVAQITADELGADWRTIAVEPAPINGLYTNDILSAEWKSGWGFPEAIQGTGSSTTLRAFEPKLRDAAAAARVLLCKAAAERWDASWEACDTEEGFVVLGKERIRFGDLAAQAAEFDLPRVILHREGGTRLAGRGVNRLDVPAKLDGSANFAADIRLPDMVYAAIRQGPPGESRLTSFDRKAASNVQGVLSIIDTKRWVAVAANSWWAANVALDRMRPKFQTEGGLATEDRAQKSLSQSLKDSGTTIVESGDAESMLESTKPVTRRYSAGFATHAALEPMAATAAIADGRLQLWISTQVPDLARTAAARAIGFEPDAVTVHAMQIGGSFGRKYEVEIAGQAALITQKLERPVQLIWSRSEDMAQDRLRPAATAELTARISGGGRIEAYAAKIATTDSVGEMVARVVDGKAAHEAQGAGKANARAVEGAVPPYAIPNLSISHHPADLGIPTGKLRAGANGFTCFFTEAFIDELAEQARRDPFSFRIGLLAGNPRLAKCLTKVAVRGGWEGGAQGTNQGVACHMMQGSFIAVLAEAKMGENGRPEIAKLTAVADVGRVMNPDIARQQIEGGLLYGLGLATGNAVTLKKGYPEPRRFGQLGLPRLADMPEISVELIRSKEAPGGIGELAVSPVAPAIANALFAGSGTRYRTLPLGQKQR